MPLENTHALTIKYNNKLASGLYELKKNSISTHPLLQ